MGSFYMQAIAAWMLASKNHTSCRTLIATCKRCGRAMTNWLKKSKNGAKIAVKNHMYEQYLWLSHGGNCFGQTVWNKEDCVWESKEDDEVWQAFYK